MMRVSVIFHLLDTSRFKPRYCNDVQSPERFDLHSRPMPRDRIGN